ncbi:MAG: hypothetical protein FWE11_01010 [Defluviitaleaceae bacterium]|nr:hypothetical protein [Defluviitaleaceae bacterium]
MPLNIASRPPSPFFNQQRRRALPTIKNPEGEKPVLKDDALRLFPLGSSGNPTPQGRRAATVNPLTHPQQPRRQTPTPQPGFSMAAPMISQPNQMPMQSTQRQPESSPEHAVNRFRRANHGLPDGVRYEPLDDATMQLLRDNGHLPELPEAKSPAPQPSIASNPVIPPSAPIIAPTASASATPPPTPVTPMFQTPLQPPLTEPEPNRQNIINIIQGLIQDERNAQVFYGHLTTQAASHTIQSTLSEIAKDCHRNSQQLSHILTTQHNSDFTPVEAKINTGLEIKEALALALEEEGKSLRVLSYLLEDVGSTSSEKIIQQIINKKTLNYIQLIRFRGVD